MVALFAIEAGRFERPTTDIDILGDARQRPSATETVTARLEQLGATLKEISGLDSDRGFRFEVEPDGPSTTLGGVEVPATAWAWGLGVASSLALIR